MRVGGKAGKGITGLLPRRSRPSCKGSLPPQGAILKEGPRHGSGLGLHGIAGAELCARMPLRRILGAGRLQARDAASL